MANSEHIKFGGDENKKPTLIIMDEVDGALESESSGAINTILNYIYTG